MQSQEERAKLLRFMQDTRGLLLELGGHLNKRYPPGKGPPHEVQIALRRKNEMIGRLDQCVVGQQSRSEREQQERAIQRAQKATIARLEKQLKDQTTSFEQERAIQRAQKATIARLERQLKDQTTSFEQERAHLKMHASVSLKTQTELNSSMGKVLPLLRGFLDAYDQEQRQRAQSATARMVATIGPASNEELARCLSELQTSFDAERVELLKKVSDTEIIHQRISRNNLSQREAALTCPITLDLYENPVVTECCGKTFSSRALREAMRRNARCPVCRSRRVLTHVNRDIANLVELHRAERSALGLPSNGVTNFTAAASASASASANACCFM